jgi:hypothetical protein
VEWRWGNERRLYLALDQVKDQDVLDDLLDALDAVLLDPFGEWSSVMRGTRYRTDRYIAALPHLWYLVFTPYPDGVPPSTNLPTLVVRDLYPLMQGTP